MTPNYFERTAARESGGDPFARNPLSTATGKYQFIRSTWDDIMRRNPSLGLTPDGRTDSAQQERAMRAFTEENAAGLKKAGFTPNDSTLYLAHRFGLGDATKMLSADPNTPVDRIVSPQVMSANPDLRGKRVADLYESNAPATFDARFNNMPTVARPVTALRNMPTDAGMLNEVSAQTKEADEPGILSSLRMHGPGALFGAPNGVFQNEDGTPGYDLGSALQGAGAGLISIMNPSGGAALMRAAQEARGENKNGLTPIFATRKGPNGEDIPVLLQMNTSGKATETALPAGVRPSTGANKLDLGTHYAITDGKTGAVVGIIPKNVEEAARQGARGGEQGKLDAARPEKFGKAQAALQSYEAADGIVSESIDKAIQGSSDWTTGLMSLTNLVPGTPAHTLAQQLSTIKANIGFDKLQTMRDNSPTGGALGQVTDFENRLLQSVLGSIEQSQSPAELKANLQRLKTTRELFKQQRREAFERDFGDMVPKRPVNPGDTKRIRFNPTTGAFD